jgi:hypothetical protein
MTHLYAADESDGVVTRGQFALLERMVSRVFAAGLRRSGCMWATLLRCWPARRLRLAAAGCLHAIWIAGDGAAGVGALWAGAGVYAGEPAVVRELRGRLLRVLAVEDAGGERAFHRARGSGGLQRDICGHGADAGGAAGGGVCGRAAAGVLESGMRCWCGGSARRLWGGSRWTRRWWM